jgi:hypothetical protein
MTSDATSTTFKANAQVALTFLSPSPCRKGMADKWQQMTTPCPVRKTLIVRGKDINRLGLAL